jgi:hypothetical protein
MTYRNLILHTALGHERPMQIRAALLAYSGDFIDDFVMDYVEADYVSALDDAAAKVRPDLIFLWGVDEIIADIDADPITSDQAADINAAIDEIDMKAIFDRHEI